MLKQELPLAYYQLLKMSEQERATLIGVQGKILITGDMNSLEVSGWVGAGRLLHSVASYVATSFIS
jgi:hypothetical protein